MKILTITGVLISSFRSFHQAYINLSISEGLKLFSGQNLVEPRLGANGAGKSSFWDAIYWCFYGTSLKGAKISSLVEWNQKTAEVMVELLVNNEPHVIYRSGPPVKIELDENPATQEEVNKLLGLTSDQFAHAIIFGQGIHLFPDLSIPERGALLDGVLNLDVWQKASKAATDKETGFDKKLTEKKIELSRIEGQLSQLQTDEYIQGQVEEWDNTHKNEVANVHESIKEWHDTHSNDLAVLQKQVEEWKEQRTTELESRATEIERLEREVCTIEDVIRELPQIELSKLQDDVKDAESSLTLSRQRYTTLETELVMVTQPRDFWLQNNNCPTCLQPIDEQKKQEHLCEIETKEQQLTNNLEMISDAIEDIKVYLQDKQEALTTLQTLKTEQNVSRESYQRDIKRIQGQIRTIENASEALIKDFQEDKHPFVRQIERLQSEINPYIRQLDDLKKRVNPHLDLLAKNKKLRDTLESKKLTNEDEIKQVSTSMLAASYWKHGFKRIRLYFVQQILAALEIEIQSAISALGLDGWGVKLATESETKSGTTKLGVQIHIRSPLAEGSWDVWSGGETQRLRLAIAMGLASLIQRAAGTWFSFETWDEPSAWLSSEGIEDLLQALQYRAESQKKSIWIVDHRALQFAGFKEIWVVSKEESGSSIQLISES